MLKLMASIAGAFILFAVGFSMLPKAEPAPAIVVYDTPASASVVLVKVAGGHGTGFYIGGNRFITAAHVAVGADEKHHVDLELSAGGPSIPGTVEWIDEARDVAMITTESVYANGNPMVLPAKLYCELPDARVGTTLHSIGFPLDMGRTETWGSVATEASRKNDNKIYAALIIAPGNSGGPVFNSKDEVIGLAQAIRLFPVGIGAINTGFSILVPRSEICAAMTSAHAPMKAAVTSTESN